VGSFSPFAMQCDGVREKAVFLSSPVTLSDSTRDNIIPPFSTISIGTPWYQTRYAAPIFYLPFCYYTGNSQLSIDDILLSNFEWDNIVLWMKTENLRCAKTSLRSTSSSPAVHLCGCDGINYKRQRLPRTCRASKLDRFSQWIWAHSSVLISK
jgi:hypothetical protein